MTLQQLKYAVTAADKGTMSEAANSLFIAQPSLTNSIKELEKELGITIFHRTNKGIIISNEGNEFLGYARQVLQQMNMLEEKYIDNGSHKQIFSVSTQHYSFAVSAFVDLIRTFGNKNYDFTLRETETYEIIEDVSSFRSEVGILYLSNENESVISRIIEKNGLKFDELFTAKPHIFISSHHPLACREVILSDELKGYPFLSFEQGNHNSFYFSEEITGGVEHDMTIKVSDRATLFNLLVGLDGYTICTGVISTELNGENIISKPLMIDEYMRVGTVTRKGVNLTKLGENYIDFLRSHI